MAGNSLDRRLIKHGTTVSTFQGGLIRRRNSGRSFSSRVRKIVMGGALAIAVSDDFVPDRNRPLGNLIRQST